MKQIKLLFLFSALLVSSMAAFSQIIILPLDSNPRKTQELYISKPYLLGLFSPEKDSNFVQVDIAFANRPGIYLLEEVYYAFIKMHDAAQLSGVNLKIISGTRNFDYQKRIWEEKWRTLPTIAPPTPAQKNYSDSIKAGKILQFTAMPGTSRHHWGTDIDINSVAQNYYLSPEGKKAYDWLKKNALSFGFCQTYTPKDSSRPLGYSEEKWHWSYFPIAQLYEKSYKVMVKHEDLKGFSGAQTAKLFGIINNYVFGTNKDCLLQKY